MVYISVDGDDVGKQLEMLLLTNNIEGTVLYVDNVRKELERIRNYLIKLEGEILFMGGDGMMVRFKEQPNIDIDYILSGNISWSIGIGKTPSGAVLALKKAKGLGKGRIEFISV